MEDKIIKCQNCGQDFVWTISDQEFCMANKLVKPEYCMICRGARKAAEKDNFRGKIENKRN